MATIQLLIKGKVQGVCYRVTARDTALRLSLTGWIRNTAQGHVEALVTGPEDTLHQFIEWCRQGPPGASVKEVVITQMPAAHFPDFSIRRV